jgi:hypothetical protein
MAKHESAFKDNPNQREIAKKLGIPRSTLQHWINRKDSIDAEPEVKDFFESPAGTAFLHRLVIAAQFVITLLGPGSVRLVCQFLELSGLSAFIAASYGSQQKVSAAIEKATVDFGKKETENMAKDMKPKDIAVCPDETFHPETCLVAIEPESNFILLETYADGRKGSDWMKAMEDALIALPVTIIQAASDYGTGIVNYVKNLLGAHHSPDIFHIQYEVVKATSAALGSKVKAALKTLESASAAVNRCIDQQVAYQNKGSQPGRKPQFDRKIQNALKKEAEALQALEVARLHQKRLQEANRNLSNNYHPVNLETGELMDTQQVANLLNQSFNEIAIVANEIQLSASSIKKITKARKSVVDMLATISFFHFTIQAKIEALSLAPTVESAVLEHLIPAFYIRRVAQKAKTAEDRRRLQAKSAQMLAQLNSCDSPFSDLSKDEISVIENVAQECVGLFQRSSSCVEGRNGQLSLRHHGLHRLSNRKLSALTVVHNFFIKRKDETTAAERFFGKKPNDLFSFLLDEVDIPGRPAKKRFKPEVKTQLIAVG